MTSPEPTLFVLIGYPGTGKLTVATELARLLTERGRVTRLVDNHTINDPVFRVVDADGVSPLGEFVWSQVDRVREAVLDTIAGRLTAGLVIRVHTRGVRQS